MKDHLELVMSGFTYIRCEKWNSKKTFYRFSIGSLDFKIVLYPTRCVDKTHIVYYDDNYSASWIVNSYYHHLNCAQTLRAVKTICALQDRYENLEFLDYLAGVAKRMSIDPRVLCSYRNYNKSFLRFDFIDSDEVKYYKMADELTKSNTRIMPTQRCVWSNILCHPKYGTLTSWLHVR